MRYLFILSVSSLILCFVAASCRSSSVPDAVPNAIPEYLEFEDCSIPEPCMLVTPETLGLLPAPLLEAAEKHCGTPGTVVLVSGVRPRYLRLLRSQGLLLLGSTEINPSHGIVFLCILSGLGEAADSIRGVRIENPDSPDTWNLGIFARRYPELTVRLNELPPGDNRLEAAEPAARELLNRSSTRIMLEKRPGADAAALEEAARAEQEQIEALEAILNGP